MLAASAAILSINKDALILLYVQTEIWRMISYGALDGGNNSSAPARAGLLIIISPTG